jgi:tetratricopeptide (TPR) repeat protein
VKARLAINHLGNYLADSGKKEEAKGKYDESVKYCDKAIELDPKFMGLDAQLK